MATYNASQLGVLGRYLNNNFLRKQSCYVNYFPHALDSTIFREYNCRGFAIWKRANNGKTLEVHYISRKSQS